MTERKVKGWVKLLKRLFAVTASAAFTISIFLILPLMQTVSTPPGKNMMVQPMDMVDLDEPPPPVEEEIVKEEPPVKPPQLVEEAPPLNLEQLELALNPSFGGDAFGDFQVKLIGQLVEKDSEQMQEIFSMAELDQRPRVIFQRKPVYPADLRRQKRQGTVYVIFQVDTSGKVMNPKVQKSTDAAFERAAVEAVRQWKFEPGTRNGEKVPFKMRVPITFNAA